MKTFFTAETQRRQRILFFIKSGDTDFMKDPAAFGGDRTREAMRVFHWRHLPPMEKIILCVLGVSAVNKSFRISSQRLN
jgi:hypothetical protein